MSIKEAVDEPAVNLAQLGREIRGDARRRTSLLPRPDLRRDTTDKARSFKPNISRRVLRDPKIPLALLIASILFAPKPPISETFPGAEKSAPHVPGAGDAGNTGDAGDPGVGPTVDSNPNRNPSVVR